MASNKMNKPIRMENYWSNCSILILVSMDVMHVASKKSIWLLLMIRSGISLMVFCIYSFENPVLSAI